jgi:DNA-binding winged helix-turn-helix (wHTH) protein
MNQKLNQTINPYLIITALCICIGFGTLSAFWKPTAIPDATAVQTRQASERINLALRRTTHLLLKLAGDSTSKIVPVKQTDDNAYLVRLEYPFNYDSLPTFLQSSFDFYDIKEKYDVAVRSCSYAELVLGYSSADFQQNQTVPCVGRTRPEGCLNFSVTFRDPSVFLLNDKKMVFSPYFWLCLGGLFTLVMGAMAYFFYPVFKQKQAVSQGVSLDIPQDSSPSMPTHSVQKTVETHLIYVGKTVFDTRKQTLLIGQTEQKLTFQEAQLLQLFCEHKNDLLERDFILKTVWGDDGVLITRSVDVFVSRLRKLLKADESLKIVNVHNRGYRFETAEV